MEECKTIGDFIFGHYVFNVFDFKCTVWHSHCYYYSGVLSELPKIFFDLKLERVVIGINFGRPSGIELIVSTPPEGLEPLQTDDEEGAACNVL